MSEKAVLHRVSTGERFERWPVDARDMMATGEYAYGEPGAPVAPPIADPLPVGEHALGGALIATKSEDAPPAKPVSIPKGRGKA